MKALRNKKNHNTFNSVTYLINQTYIQPCLGKLKKLLFYKHDSFWWLNKTVYVNYVTGSASLFRDKKKVNELELILKEWQEHNKKKIDEKGKKHGGGENRMLPAALRSSVCVNLYFVDFFVFALAFLVVIVEGVIPPLKLFHIACLWPPIHLSTASNKNDGLLSISILIYMFKTFKPVAKTEKSKV